MTAPLCLNSTVIDALGDWSKWTYAIASSLYGDPTDKGMPAYQAVIKRYKAEKNAPDPWHIVAFSELLTTVRFLNEVGAKNVNASRRQGSWRGRRRSRARSRSERRSSSAASTRTHRRSATTCSRRSRTRASSVQAGVRLDRPTAGLTEHAPRSPSDGAGRLAGPVALILAERRERDPPLPPARPRDRGDDRRHRRRHRRHVPRLRLHQPGSGRDRHARGLLVLGAPDR